MLSNDHDQLVALGWDDWFNDRFAQLSPGDGLAPARVVADHGVGRVVHTGTETIDVQLDRRLVADARRRGESLLPAVGDWVALRRTDKETVVEAVVERRGALRRKVAGQASQDQVMAANVDVVIIVAALETEPNLRRIERALAAVLASGARPVVLLTKADVAGEDWIRLTIGVRAIAGGAPVLAVSAVTGSGIDELPALVPAGQTAVLLGPSGAGKSTLVNRLAGDQVMRTAAVRSDGKGRHTTTHRELVVLPWGGLLIDTPGLRELQLWTDVDTGEGLARLFGDVAAITERCRFSNCGHTREPGCAVRAAIASGDLSQGRWDSYLKLRHEAAAVDQRVVRRRAQEAATGRRRRLARLREDDLMEG